MHNIECSDDTFFTKVKESVGKEEAAYRARHPDTHMGVLVTSL